MEQGIVEGASGGSGGIVVAASRPRSTFLGLVSQRFERLAAAVGFRAQEIAEAIDVLQDLFEPWGHDPVGLRPAIVSDIADDHSPVELSLVLTGAAPEIRVLFEARGDDSSPLGRWVAGERVNARIAARYEGSVDRLERIRDLFVPSTRSRFSMWHAVCFQSSRAPAFKLYVNPQAQGRDQAPAVVREAVARLGFPRAAGGVATCLRTADELKFFSLDLDDSPRARVKIYKVHHDASRMDIERELSAARDHTPGAIASFWRAVAPGDGPFRGLPISTYLALTSEDERPTTGAVHFPVRDYWRDDRVIQERTADFLEGVDRDIYLRGLNAFAARPLEEGVGLQSYVSLRQHRGARRVTVYLSLEAYDVAAPSPGAMLGRVTRPTSPELFTAAGSALAQTLTRDREVRTATASDMGGLVSRLPGAVARPRTREDVQAIMHFCRERGIPVAARGQAHTPFGQSQVPEGGVALDLGALDGIREITSDRLIVGAGATWKQVIEATRPLHLAPPVLTAFQGLSVGGTLSVGGLSGVSYRRGAQVDHVLELEVVTGKGELLSCSRDKNAELFDMALAGLGQCAVIVGAVLRVAALPTTLRHQVVPFEDMSSFLRALRELARAQRADGLSGTIHLTPQGPRYELNAFELLHSGEEAPCEWMREIVGAKSVEISRQDHATFYLAVDALLADLRARGLWDGRARPWLDLFLPDAALDGYLERTLATLDPAVDVGPPELASLGQIHLFPLWRRNFGRPLLRLPDDELVFLFDILTCSHEPRPGATYTRRLLDRNFALYEEARAVGGTRYGIAALPFSRADWIRELGPIYGRLARQKTIHDPDHLLGASVGIF